MPRIRVESFTSQCVENLGKHRSARPDSSDLRFGPSGNDGEELVLGSPGSSGMVTVTVECGRSREDETASARDARDARARVPARAQQHNLVYYSIRTFKQPSQHAGICATATGVNGTTAQDAFCPSSRFSHAIYIYL